MIARGTFVSVGNAHQPFDRMLEMVKQVIRTLPQPVTVQRGHTHFECDECEVVDFISMDSFLSKISETELVIIHAGAGSVIHAVAAGKVPVVVPRRAKLNEHIDEHQVDFAVALAREGKAVAVLDDADLIALAAHALEMQATRGGTSGEPSAMARAVTRAIDELEERDAE